MNSSSCPRKSAPGLKSTIAAIRIGKSCPWTKTPRPCQSPETIDRRPGAQDTWTDPKPYEYAKDDWTDRASKGSNRASRDSK
eukprot:7575328-Pyramimonas_sp.AAC.1